MTIGTSVITVIQNLTNEKAQKSNIPFEAKVYIVDNSNKELISELESVLTKYKWVECNLFMTGVKIWQQKELQIF